MEMTQNSLNNFVRQQNCLTSITCFQDLLWYYSKDHWEQNRESSKKQTNAHRISIEFGQNFEGNLMGKDSLFNRWCWNHWLSIWKIMNLPPYTKINSNGLEA